MKSNRNFHRNRASLAQATVNLSLVARHHSRLSRARARVQLLMPPPALKWFIRCGDAIRQRAAVVVVVVAWIIAAN